MKVLFFTLVLFFTHFISAQDTTFYDLAASLDSMEKRVLFHEWGSENVVFLGTMKWQTPSGKILDVKIVTTYQKITKANGFNDRSLLALLTAENKLVKIYDMVKRQNLPQAIEDNLLVFQPSPEERLVSELPNNFGERFCVVGLTCFNAYIIED